MAKGPIQHDSRFFGRRLQLLTKDASVRAPRLAKATERRLIKLAQQQGYRLERARINKSEQESIIQDMRKAFLKSVPPSVYGWVARGKKRTMRILLVRQTFKTITDNGAFLAYLGEYRKDVVKGMALPTTTVLLDADSYARFVQVMNENFGPGVADGILLQIDTSRLNELVDAGLLKPSDQFFKNGQGPVHVHANSV